MKRFVSNWDCQRLQSSGIATHSTIERPKTEALSIINATEKLSCHTASIITTAELYDTGTPFVSVTVCTKSVTKPLHNSEMVYYNII